MLIEFPQLKIVGCGCPGGDTARFRAICCVGQDQLNSTPFCIREFRMGVQAGALRIRRRITSGTNVIGVLEVWPLICSAAVAVGAITMIAVMLYNDWSAPY